MWSCVLSKIYYSLEIGSFFFSPSHRFMKAIKELDDNSGGRYCCIPHNMVAYSCSFQFHLQTGAATANLTRALYHLELIQLVL